MIAIRQPPPAVRISEPSDATTLPNSNVAGAHELLATVMRAVHIATATDIYLDLKCADVGAFRKPATYATTSLIFTSNTPAPAAGIYI